MAILNIYIDFRENFFMFTSVNLRRCVRVCAGVVTILIISLKSVDHKYLFHIPATKL